MSSTIEIKRGEGRLHFAKDPERRGGMDETAAALLKGRKEAFSLRMPLSLSLSLSLLQSPD